jgi:CRISPR-associated endonuclease Cas1
MERKKAKVISNELPPRLRKQPGGMAQGKELPMHRDCTVIPPIESIPVKNSIVVLRGYGLVVRVEHGRLLLMDGVAKNRRQGKFTKATSGLKRLVVLGHSGTISLEGIRWLHDIGAAIVQIDADGNLLLASSPLKETYSHLRRAQALAADNEIGLEIVRDLLRAKLEGQAEFVKGRFSIEVDKITSLSSRLDLEDKPDRLRLIEARAASLYWSTWADVEMRFSRQDKNKIPRHWKTFGKRVSSITGSPRNASNPANALLNYLYAILEAESRIALLTVGLDPGMGLLHADQTSRDSMALDVMEAVRPQVDIWLYEFVTKNTFAKRDFFERRDGTVRVSSHLTSILAETAAMWAWEVGPLAEKIASTLARSTTISISTPLTEANRSAGRDPHRRSPSSRRKVRTLVLKTCPECGKVFRKKNSEFCSRACWDRYNQEVVMPKLAKAGPDNFAKLRQEGKDPNHGGEIGRKRGESNTRRRKERLEWEEQNPDVDIEKAKQFFQREILSKLGYIPLSTLMEATGLSKRYVSMIRRGLYTPHPMHYQNLEELILLYNEASGG